jgi:hypothetical protein
MVISSPGVEVGPGSLVGLAVAAMGVNVEVAPLENGDVDVRVVFSCGGCMAEQALSNNNKNRLIYRFDRIIVWFSLNLTGIRCFPRQSGKRIIYSNSPYSKSVQISAQSSDQGPET